MPGTAENAVRIGVAVVLGGIGGAAGFHHTHQWAEQNGQHGWLAWAVAVVVEGIAVVAGFEIRRDHRRGHHQRLTFPVAVLVIGFGIQMAAQVANARPTVAGWLLAALPALGFLVVVKLLMRGTTPHPGATTQEPPAPVTSPGSPAPVTVERVEPVEPVADQPVRELPAAPVASVRPVSSSVKLPPALAEKVTTAIDTARAQGREPTAEDIRRVVKLPDAVTTQLLADLPPVSTTNGHRLT